MSATPHGICPKCKRPCETGERIRVPSRSGQTVRVLCPECCAKLSEAARARIAPGDRPAVVREMRCHACNARFGDLIPVPVPTPSGNSVRHYCVLCACALPVSAHRRLEAASPIHYSRLLAVLFSAAKAKHPRIRSRR